MRVLTRFASTARHTLICGLAACGSTPTPAPVAGSQATPAENLTETPRVADQAEDKFSRLSASIDSMAQGDPVDASWLERELKEVLRLAPRHPQARFNLAKIQELKGEIAGARAVYAELHQDDPAFAPAAEEVARQYLADGDLERAVELYRRNVEKDAKNLTSRLALARIFLEQGSRAKSIKLCREVLQRDAKSVEAFRVLAQSFYENQNLPMAELVVGRGLKIHPRDTQLQYTLAQVLFAGGDLVGGVSKLKEVIALDPKGLRARAELAGIAFEYRDYANAAQQYEAIVKEGTASKSVRLALAVSYSGMGRSDQAETLFRELLTQKSDDIDVQWNFANLLYRRGEYAGAIGLLTEVKKADEPKLSEQAATLLDKVRREKDDAAAQAERRAREEARSKAISAACGAVASKRPINAEAIGNVQERVEAAWQLIVEAQQLFQAGKGTEGESRILCAFGILPDNEGVRKEACAPMRVTWTQMLFELGRVEDALENTREGLKCDAENPELLLIEQQLLEILANQGGQPAPE